jgi:ferredoxin--NADP+ reductase
MAMTAKPAPEQLADPVLPDAVMNVVKPTEPVIGRVTRNESCMRGKSASFVRHVAIDVSGTPIEGKFLAGQAFGVIPPGTDAKGRPEKVRLYSIASPSCGEDGEGRILSTTCKRLIDEFTPQTGKDDPDRHDLVLGKCSNYLCDLNVGDEVLVSGPSGKRFLLPVEPARHDYLFLATGTGIAPYRGMVHDLLEGPDGPVDSQIHLVMGVGYTSDLLYDEEWRALSEKHPNFHYHTVISREVQPDGARGGYIHHYLDRQIELHESLLKSDRTLMYMCGLAGMQIGVFQLLARLGLGDGYLKIKDELAGVDPSEWDAAGIKRHVRPTHRCMLEVY